MPNSNEDTIFKLPLQCLGILWCKADYYIRALNLFELLVSTKKIGESQTIKKNDSFLREVFGTIITLAIYTFVKIQKGDDKTQVEDE